MYCLVGGCVVGEIVIGGEGELGYVRMKGLGVEWVWMERERGWVAIQRSWVVVERVRRRRERVMEDRKRRVLPQLQASPSPLRRCATSGS